jgi:hypothetical protein
LSFQHGKRVDRNERLLPGILHMKVRSRMVSVLHSNDDPKEPADLRHRQPTTLTLLHSWLSSDLRRRGTTHWFFFAHGRDC